MVKGKNRTSGDMWQSASKHPGSVAAVLTGFPHSETVSACLLGTEGILVPTPHLKFRHEPQERVVSAICSPLPISVFSAGKSSR